MKKTLASLLVLASVSVIMPACHTAPTSTSEREQLIDKSNNTVDEFRKTDPSISDLLNRSAGYAVLPKVGKAGVGVGGAYGKGVVYERGTPIGWTDMTQASIGFQLGAQGYSELIVFEDQAALDRFKAGNFEFSAAASAVALKSGAAANAKFENGVAIFIKGEAGLMYEASVGGQKFTFRPL